jgi:hypothetical protein
LSSFVWEQFWSASAYAGPGAGDGRVRLADKEALAMQSVGNSKALADQAQEWARGNVIVHLSQRQGR